MLTTIKVSTETRDRIKALGATRNKSAEAVVLEALDELDRRVFWDQMDAAVDLHGPNDLRDESELFAAALKDGLDDE
jgi:hypothetical protein